MSRSIIACACLLSFCALCATARAQPNPPSGDWQLTLQGDYMYGAIDGYVQVPSGGEPGTSSSKRPTFSELGIDNASIYEVRFQAAWRDEQFFGSGQFTRVSGSAMLDQQLITHGVTFPAGSQLSSDITLDWYEFGYRHRFTFGPDDRGRDQFTLLPSIGVAIFNFDYSTHATAGASASRSYIKLTPQLGIELDWRPSNGPFWLALQLEGSPPISPPLPLLYVEKLTANYQLLHGRYGDLAIFAGIAFEQMFFEDNQTVPNKTRADIGPAGIFGLSFSF